MNNDPKTLQIMRAKPLAVAGLLALCLLIAALFASGWQWFASSQRDDLERRNVTPYLGITYVPLSHQLAARYGVDAGTGVLVTDVADGSPARRAGLRRGDTLLSADSRTFTRLSSPVQRLSEHRPGDRMSIQLLRDGETLSVEITLGAAP